jgi:hypothetical protein
MEPADRQTRTMRRFTAVKRSRQLLAGVSLTVMTSVLALGGAGGVAQASTPPTPSTAPAPTPTAPAPAPTPMENEAESTFWEFWGEVHPPGKPKYCLSALGTAWGNRIYVVLCGATSYFDEWSGQRYCKKIGGKELCTGFLVLLTKNGENPVDGGVGVFGPTSPSYKKNKNVILCPLGATKCLTGLGWIPVGTSGTEDEMWVPSRSNAAILWPKSLSGSGDVVSLGSSSAKKYDPVWSHPKWEQEQS